MGLVPIIVHRYQDEQEERESKQMDFNSVSSRY